MTRFYDQNGTRVPFEYWKTLHADGIAPMQETIRYRKDSRCVILTFWTGIDQSEGEDSIPEPFETIAAEDKQIIHRHSHPSAMDALACHYGVMLSLYPKPFRRNGFLRRVYDFFNTMGRGIRYPHSVLHSWINLAIWAFVAGTNVAAAAIPPYDWFTPISAVFAALTVWAFVGAIQGIKYARDKKKEKDEQAKHDEAFESIMSKEYGDDPSGD